MQVAVRHCIKLFLVCNIFSSLGPVLSSQDDICHVFELIKAAVTTVHVSGPLASSSRRFLKHLEKQSID